MEVKDKVKQRRIERLRNLRETSETSNGNTIRSNTSLNLTEHGQPSSIQFRTQI